MKNERRDFVMSSRTSLAWGRWEVKSVYWISRSGVSQTDVVNISQFGFVLFPPQTTFTTSTHWNCYTSIFSLSTFNILLFCSPSILLICYSTIQNILLFCYWQTRFSACPTAKFYSLTLPWQNQVKYQRKSSNHHHHPHALKGCQSIEEQTLRLGCRRPWEWLIHCI